jgi:YbgC/YbaW family acyl-CoA thioester hydrolase
LDNFFTLKGLFMLRQFRHTYTVRYDESDSYGYLTPTAFLRYMQDIAALDAEDAHVEGDGYWIIKRTLVSFRTPVPLLTRLEVTTYGMGFTRVTAQRGYDARIIGSEDKDPVISARTVWVYIDTRGRPARFPERTTEVWFPDGSVRQQPDQPWPAFPQDPSERLDYTVRFSDIDSYRHMNNATYVELLDNAAWETYRQRGTTPDDATIHALEYDIEYKESARLGDQLEIQSWFDPSPSAGQEFSRLQLITRDGVELVRARSHWQWK